MVESRTNNSGRIAFAAAAKRPTGFDRVLPALAAQAHQYLASELGGGIHARVGAVMSGLLLVFKLRRLMAVAACSDKEFIAFTAKGCPAIASVVDLGCRLLPANFTDAFGPFQDSATDDAPESALQISGIRRMAHSTQIAVALVVGIHGVILPQRGTP